MTTNHDVTNRTWPDMKQRVTGFYFVVVASSRKCKKCCCARKNLIVLSMSMVGICTLTPSCICAYLCYIKLYFRLVQINVCFTCRATPSLISMRGWVWRGEPDTSEMSQTLFSCGPLIWDDLWWENVRIASKLAYHMPTWLAERTARFDADADPFWALCISDCSSVPEFGERKRTGVCCEKGNTRMMISW